MTKWEYDVLEEPPRDINYLVDQMNEKGADGWEAFAIVPVGRTTNSVVLFLKRPRS